MAINQLRESKIKHRKYKGTREKLWDGGGLYLHVLPTGNYWRYDFQVAGKRRSRRLGLYPSVTLTEARNERNRLKLLVLDGIDPTLETQKTKKAPSFRDIAETWQEQRGHDWSASHRKNVKHRLKNYILPVIGDVPLPDVKPDHVRTILDKVAAAGHYETARKVRQYISQICNFGIVSGHIESDPAHPLIGYLKRPKNASSFAHTTNPKQLGEILRAIEGYEGMPSTVYALRIAPHIFLRPGELRGAEWEEVDLKRARWDNTSGANETKIQWQPHNTALKTGRFIVQTDPANNWRWQTCFSRSTRPTSPY